MVNPKLSKSYSKVSGCLVRECSNITTSLLFRFEKDQNGVVFVRDKADVDQTLWSEPFYPFHNTPSGLSLDNMRGGAFKTVPQERLDQIDKTLEAMQWRLDEHQKM
jgi:hypothetical protein